MLRRELPVLFAIFLDLIGFGMAFPDIQLRAEKYGANGWQIGALIAAYFVVQIIVSPLWGQLSDRIGRKPVLLVCTALSALSMVAYAFLPHVWGILLARVLAGLAAANVVVGQAYLADITTEEQRPGAMGRVSSAILLGLFLGPVAGGFIAHEWGNYGLGLSAAAASALSCVWIVAGVPFEAPRERREPGKKSFSLRPRIIAELPAIRQLLIVAMAGWFVLACLEGTFGRLIEHTLNYDQRHFGILFSYESLLGAGVGALLGHISKRFTAGAIIRAGYIIQGVGIALTPFAWNMESLFAASTLWGFGLGIANPTINAVVSEATPPDRQGEIFGLLQAARSFGFIVGPVLGGAMFDVEPALPYLVAAVVACLAGLLVATPRKASTAATTTVP